jgi:hypothetical protein
MNKPLLFTGLGAASICVALVFFAESLRPPLLDRPLLGDLADGPTPLGRRTPTSTGHQR